MIAVLFVAVLVFSLLLVVRHIERKHEEQAFRETLARIAAQEHYAKQAKSPAWRKQQQGMTHDPVRRCFYCRHVSCVCHLDRDR